ncbi:MAG TPA: TIGR01906 family membrane protein [Anaerolineales bacterium]|nr:TIGR01906 family membrane protein [Anaerolineales bacterium]
MKTLYRIFSWLITLLLPVALTFVGLRLLLTHAFPEIEYRLPGFPADDFGFNLQDRLHWSKLSIDYLVNGADISFLGNLTFSDGSPVFNERELSHMHDVKGVVQPVLVIGYSVWFLMLGLAVWARWGGWWPEYLAGIRRGGWLISGLVVVLGILAATSFWQFFTVFHELFFKGNSWLFDYSDTLIRLFPIPFWESAFGFAGFIDLAGGLALALGLRPKAK